MPADLGQDSPNPTRLLIYEPSFRAAQDAILDHAGSIQLVLLHPDGQLSLTGRAVSAEDASPHIAWASGEMFESPVARKFLAAMLNSPRLDWVQSGAAGFDHPLFAQIIAKGARLTTSHGQSVGMADYVLAGVLDHFQRGPARRAAQAERNWRRVPFREVAGSVWLVVGFGAIGQEVAKRARAFGARIHGVRRDPAPHALADEILSLEAMTSHLPEADVVVLCLPASRATRGLADAGFFEVMKPGSVLVNVGRGALVDEAALLRGLDRGTPEHAVLDVFQIEPLTQDSPFWAHPCVTLTGHTSGNTLGQKARNQALFIDNLDRFLRGAALIGEVDPKDVLDAS